MTRVAQVCVDPVPPLSGRFESPPQTPPVCAANFRTTGCCPSTSGGARLRRQLARTRRPGRLALSWRKGKVLHKSTRGVRPSDTSVEVICAPTWGAQTAAFTERRLVDCSFPTMAQGLTEVQAMAKIHSAFSIWPPTRGKALGKIDAWVTMLWKNQELTYKYTINV